jgi:hypothetical protein
MKTYRKLAWTFLMLVFVVVAMTPMASAKGSEVRLQRGATDVRPGTPSTSFGGPSRTADMCSGSCSCSFCSCSGSSGCCDAGCDACWNYRDTHGLCGTAIE